MQWNDACHTLLPMPLTDNQLAELEKLGVRAVLLRLENSGTGRGATMQHMASGIMQRGDVEDWLAQRTREEAEQQAETLRFAKLAAEQQIVAVRWAKIAGWAAGLSIVVSVFIAGLQWGLTPK